MEIGIGLRYLAVPVMDNPNKLLYPIFQGLSLNVWPTIISAAPHSVTHFLNQHSTSETVLSSTAAPYLAVFTPLSVGAALLLLVGVSQVFYDRLKRSTAGNSGSVNCHHSSGPLTGSAEDGTDYENNSPGNHKSVTMSLDYQNLSSLMASTGTALGFLMKAVSGEAIMLKSQMSRGKWGVAILQWP
ncbi:hypothetical protein SRHO_G00179310 [Serrasalmus rhombeus]